MIQQMLIEYLCGGFFGCLLGRTMKPRCSDLLGGFLFFQVFPCCYFLFFFSWVLGSEISGYGVIISYLLSTLGAGMVFGKRFRRLATSKE